MKKKKHLYAIKPETRWNFYKRNQLYLEQSQSVKYFAISEPIPVQLTKC